MDKVITFLTELGVVLVFVLIVVILLVIIGAIIHGCYKTIKDNCKKS